MRQFQVVVVTFLGALLGLGLAAGVLAQAGGKLLTISRVDAESFPQVSLNVGVSGELTASTELAPGDFQLFEDGTPLPASAVSVERAAPQGLRLVIGLDVSGKEDWLGRLKETTKAFFGTLQPQDRVMILIIQDQVRVAQDFTNNQQVLNAVVDTLAAEGNYTALYAASVEAITRLEPVSDGRRAIILLTNSRDNASTITLDDVTAAAQAAKVPIYLVGYDKAKPDVLGALAAASGGRSFMIPALSELPATLNAVSVELEQSSYQITFQSRLKADDAPHSVRVGLAGQGEAGQAEGQFTAVRRPVSVSLLNLADGRTLSGTFTLQVEVSAPAPVSSTAYLLDEQPLAEVTRPPYAYDWDTTSADPGSHRLTATVVDQAGNQGQAAAALILARLMTVTLSVSHTELALGSPLELLANVSPSDPPARVAFLVDDKWLGSAQAPPYQFTLDTSPYPAGEHVVSVQAESSFGQSATASQKVRLFPSLPRPASLVARFVTWFKTSGLPPPATIGGGLLGVGVLLAMMIGGLALIVRSHHRQRQLVYQLELVNQGNVASQYRLKAEDPGGALKFAFSINGVRLSPPPPPPRPRPVAPPARLPAPPPLLPAPAPSPAAGRAARVASGAPARPLAGATQATDRVMGKAKAAGGILSALGTLLPGAAGAAAQQAALPIAQTTGKVGAAQFRAQSQLAAVENVAGKVRKGAPLAAPAAPAAGVPAAAAFAGPYGAAGAAGRPNRASVPRAPAAGTPRPPVPDSWLRTPVVAPNETLRLDLLITVVKARPAWPYVFKVCSRPVEPEEAAPVIEEGTLQLAGIAWWRRLESYGLYLLGSAIAGQLVWWLWTRLGILG